jgi:hypothetical protein
VRHARDANELLEVASNGGTRRALHVQGLVRPLVVEDLNEPVGSRAAFFPRAIRFFAWSRERNSSSYFTRTERTSELTFPKAIAFVFRRLNISGTAQQPVKSAFAVRKLSCRRQLVRRVKIAKIVCREGHLGDPPRGLRLTRNGFLENSSTRESAGALL